MQFITSRINLKAGRDKPPVDMRVARQIVEVCFNVASRAFSERITCHM